MFRMVIFIPTMNRDKSIGEYLEKCIDDCIENNIGIYVYDTSTDNKTWDVVQAYTSKGEKYRNAIIYYKNNDYHDKTTDLKIYEGLLKVRELSDYVWVCGDGIVPRIPHCCSLISYFIDNSFDLVQFDKEKNQTNSTTETINSPVTYFQEKGWIATSYGATILATKHIDEELLRLEYEQFQNTGFVYWHYLFTKLGLLKAPRIAIINTDYFSKNSNKKSNASHGKGRFFKFWIDNWLKAVYSLPDVYNEHKEKVAKDIGIHMNLYSLLNLLLLRGTGNLDHAIFLKYKNDFSKVTDVPLSRIALISRFPKTLSEIYVKLRSYISGKLNR